METANYRKFNDRQLNSSKYHKLDGTNIRAKLKVDLQAQMVFEDIDVNTEPSRVHPAHYFENIYDYQSVLDKHATGALQSSFLDEDASVLVYRSGANNISDMRGYIDAGKAIGVCALEVSANAKTLLCEYVKAGGQCMVDSGAFRLFNARMRGKACEELNFDKILNVYEEIINQACGGDITVVAPDIVGDQDASYLLLVKFQDKIRRLAKLDANVMVPLQRGALTINDYYEKVVNLLGKDFVWGIPFNAKALSETDILDFVSEFKPSSVHFLGCSENYIIHKAMAKSPNTRFSSDATRLRAQIGKNRLLTEMQSQLTDENVQVALHGGNIHEIGTGSEFDETEVLCNLANILESFSKNELIKFACALNTNSKAIREAIQCENLWSHLEAANHGYATYYVGGFFENIARKQLSKRFRTHAVKTLAMIDVI
jgi:hypothetical protein